MTIMKRTLASVYRIPKWKLRFIRSAGRYKSALIFTEIPIEKRTRHGSILDF